MAYDRASRPKPAKPVVNPALRERVERDLERKRSPEQIAGRLRADHPDDPGMWVSTETIHQSLYAARYVRSRGALRRDLATCLRTGTRYRAGAAGPQPPGRPAQEPGPARHGQRQRAPRGGRLPGAADRAVPGHWEGDLIVGKANATAIGTLVERTTGHTLLVHLPGGYKPERVAPALAAKIRTLPRVLRGSLTWDRGVEMRDWKQVSVAADIAVYFCDPHSPWQRGTNENTNGLLRRYAPLVAATCRCAPRRTWTGSPPS